MRQKIYNVFVLPLNLWALDMQHEFRRLREMMWFK